MFRGRYEHSVDAKGRTSFPAKFRDYFEKCGQSRLILTAGLDRCAVTYPLEEWDRFEEKLSALPQFDRSVTLLKRIYVSGAVECEFDKVGRILLPASLRKHARLKKRVLWAGMGDHIELWSLDEFEKLTDSTLGDEKERRRIAQRLAELGL